MRPVLQWPPMRGRLSSRGSQSHHIARALGPPERRSCRGGARGDHDLTPGASRHGSRVSPHAVPRSRRCRRVPPRAIIARVHSVARPSYQDCCCVWRRKMHARRRPCAWIAPRHRHAATAAVRGGGAQPPSPATALRRHRQPPSPRPDVDSFLCENR